MAQTAVRVASNSYERVVLELDFGPFETTEITTEKGIFTKISSPDFCSSNDVGNPDLPVLSKLIEMPLCDRPRVRIIAKDSVIVSAAELGIAHPIFPAQRSRSKSDDTPIITEKNDETYRTNAFYHADLVSVNSVGVARSINMGNVFFSPIQYNPVTNEFIIFRHVTAEITYENANISATQQMKSLHSSGGFSAMTQVINPIRTRDHLLTAPIRYLIVAHSSFRGQLDSFIRWKKRKGFLVTVAYTDDAAVGTTKTSIANYIKSQYDNATAENPAPLYVLLVGDVAQIPTYTGESDSGHKTDLYYFTWTGNDLIPDCYYGRFSAQNVAQLTPQIEKTLMYEQYLMDDPTYLDRALLIAGIDQGRSGDYGYTHANPTMHYIEDVYVNSTNGYTTVNSFYNPHPSTSTSTIRTLLSQGYGLANYSAHCSASGWADPSFTTTHVSSMTNSKKFGLMIGNCCESNRFEQSECFGEAVLRKGNYCGAVGYIGGSNSTYWNEDYYWSVGLRNITNNQATPTYNANNLGVYDRLFHTHNEPYSAWYLTNGAIMMAGNMAVESSTSPRKAYYWEIYHLMGDPSVMTWLTQAETMTVTASSVLNGSATSLTVHAVPYAYVALTDTALNLVAAAFADATGDVTLNFSNLTCDRYELVATAQNYIPYFQNITVSSAPTAHLQINNFTLASGSTPNEGNTVRWDIEIKNVGTLLATNVHATLTESSPHLTLTTSSATVGTISTNQTRTISAIFSGNIAALVADQTTIPLTVTLTYDTNKSTTLNTDLVVNSANVQKTAHTFTEQSGNSNDIFEAGETVSLQVQNVNTGHCAANNVTTSLSTYYNGVTITNSPANLGNMAIADSAAATFSIAINSAVPNGSIIPFYYNISYGNRQITDTMYLFIGRATEDFENNNFTTFAWTNSSNQPWQITTSNVYEGRYSARSKSSLGNNRTSTLSITWTSTIDGEFSYFRKVSSEEGYDFFTLKIDGETKEELSGTVAWGRAAFFIPAGTHTYTFSYAKDQYTTGGSDCAWIDFITFPPAGEFPENFVIEHHADVDILSAEMTNNSANYGETITFDLILANQGDTAATNVTCNATTTAPFVSIQNAQDNIGAMAIGQMVRQNKFTTIIDEYVADQSAATFTFTARWDNNQSDVRTKTIVINAPILSTTDSDLSEIVGNGDQIPNPGETYKWQIDNTNNGHADISQLTATLTANNPLVTISNGTQYIDNLQVNTIEQLDFDIIFSENLTNGTEITFDYRLEKGSYYVEQHFIVVIQKTEEEEEEEEAPVDPIDPVDPVDPVDPIDPTSIAEQSVTHLQIFPNPVEDLLTVKSSSNMLEINILDVTGKLVKKISNLHKNQQEIDVTHLSSGIYIIKIIDEESRASIRKFIK